MEMSAVVISPTFYPHTTNTRPTQARREPHTQEKTAKRASAQRRVYGKRKENAPRAVFEERSPQKNAERMRRAQRKSENHNTSDDAQNRRRSNDNGATNAVADKIEKELQSHDSRDSAVEKDLSNVEEKFAGIKIEDVKSHRNREEGRNNEGLEVDMPSTDMKPQVEIPTKRSSRKGTPERPGKTYQIMKEVRIYSRRSTENRGEPQHQPQQEQEQEQEQKQPSQQQQQLDVSSQSPTPVRTTVQTRRRATRPKPAPRLSSGCVQDEKATAYAQPILNEALSPVSFQGIQKFSSWASRAENMFEVVKLAEGSYGEVYKLHFRPEMCKEAAGFSKSKLARLRSYGNGVFKVVPLRAQSGPGSKSFTSIDEIVSEVRMLKYLDPIPGFARFREIHVVQGRFPKPFQDAWMHYKHTRPADDCLNPNPASKKAYPDKQLWAILEMDDAGCELEKFSWSSVFQIYDIFWGVAMALARAEEYALFEHRDLHLGNVCIRTTRPDGCMNPPTDVELTKRTSSSGYGLSTLETTIIDYSLSRAEFQNEDGKADIASCDLDEKELFDAVGQDEDEALLRDTYRHMRAAVYDGRPISAENAPNIPGIWSDYAPRTNLVWLLFLLKNLLKNRKPEPLPDQHPSKQHQHQQTPRKPLAPCSANKRGKGRAHEQKLGATTGKQQQHNHQYAKGSGRPDSEALLRASLLKKVLEDRMVSVRELLDLEHGSEDMCCAADLVAFAIDEGWLEERDFF